MKKSKLLRKYEERLRWDKLRKFLEGFKPKYLVKIVQYHNLYCADLKQYRCLMKSLRKSNLNYQDIWRAIIND